MSDKQPLEDDVRRALRASADALVVEDHDFDPARTGTVGLPEIEPERTRRAPLQLLVAAVVIVVLVSAVVIAARNGGSKDAVRVAGEPTTSTTGAAPTATIGSNPEPSALAPPALVTQVTSVPADVLATVGKGSVTAFPVGLPGPVLATTDGKPRIVWIGAEYCPFCAAQRWPLVQALSRFGTFSGLKTIASPRTTPAGGPEVFPNTPGFSFTGSVYKSDYLNFESVEEETTTYRPLETPTAEQQQLVEKYDAPPYVDAQSTGAIPFIDFANTFLSSGASYDTGVLRNRTHAEIASALSDPTSDIAQGIDGTANVITATICSLTNKQPAAVCDTPTITSIDRAMSRRP